MWIGQVNYKLVRRQILICEVNDNWLSLYPTITCLFNKFADFSPKATNVMANIDNNGTCGKVGAGMVDSTSF